jgi:hypothetical protein
MRERIAKHAEKAKEKITAALHLSVNDANGSDEIQEHPVETREVAQVVRATIESTLVEIVDELADNKEVFDIDETRDVITESLTASIRGALVTANAMSSTLRATSADEAICEFLITILPFMVRTMTASREDRLVVQTPSLSNIASAWCTVL